MDSIIDQVRRLQNEDNTETVKNTKNEKSFIKSFILTILVSLVKSIYRSTILWFLLMNVFSRLNYTQLDWITVFFIYSIYDMFILSYLVDKKDNKINSTD